MLTFHLEKGIWLLSLSTRTPVSHSLGLCLSSWASGQLAVQPEPHIGSPGAPACQQHASGPLSLHHPRGQFPLTNRFICGSLSFCFSG